MESDTIIKFNRHLDKQLRKHNKDGYGLTAGKWH